MATDEGRAEVKRRRDDLVVIANSVGGAVGITDWEAFVERVSAVEVDDAQLGRLVRTCLLRSRRLPSEWIRDRMRDGGDYRVRLAEAFGLRSTKTLFPGMKSVHVEYGDGRVVFGPSKNRRGGSFQGFERGAKRGHEDVVVAFSASDADLGGALREALMRCL